MTVQLGGGNWVEPGAVITEPPALVAALVKRPDFEEVDSTAEPSEPEKPRRKRSRKPRG
jgi:hypothetical protein